jgi:GTPase
MLVLNKIDVIDPLTARRLRNRYPDAVQISARTGEGLDELKRRVAEFFADRYIDMRLLLPHDRGAALSELYASGAPITAREDVPDGVLVTARLPVRMVGRYGIYRADDR